MCVGPARRLFCPLYFQPFYSYPKMKNTAARGLAEWGWKQALANQQLPARPPASRSRFRPDLETNKRNGGAGGLGGGSGRPSCTQSNYSAPRPGDPAGIAPRPSRYPLPCQVLGSAFQGVLVHSELGSSTVRFGPQDRPPFSPGETQGRMLQLRRLLPPFCAVFPGLLLGLCVRVARRLTPVVLSRHCLRVSEHPDPGPGIITASLLDLLTHRVIALRCLLPGL